MFRLPKGRRLAAVAVFTVACAGSRVAGEPLQQEACDALKAEQAKLEAAGVGNDLRRGADWGRTNLAAARIGEVLRLITVTEQIAFRCPPPPPPQQQAHGAAAESGESGRKTDSTIAIPVRKPTQGRPKVQAKTGGAGEGGTPAKAKQANAPLKNSAAATAPNGGGKTKAPMPQATAGEPGGSAKKGLEQ